MKEPNNSCPSFDAGIEIVKRLLDIPELEEYHSELGNIIDYIEEGRDINSKLRDWGYYWKENSTELEEQISVVKEENHTIISGLEDEITDLRNKIKELENDKEDLESTINNLEGENDRLMVEVYNGREGSY